MRRIMSVAATALALVAGTVVTTTGTASAGSARATHVVRPGQSIQAAIDRARPGDTIRVRRGVYREALVITTDNLTLRGSGRTVLRMPARADNACTELTGGRVVGICVLGELDFQNFQVIDPVRRPRISGFTVRGFSETGILAIGTVRARITHNKVRNNRGYGIFAIVSTRPYIAHNRSTGNHDAGIYVGSNQNVRARVLHNVSRNNPIGIFLRDVSHGAAKRNRVIGNCSGIVMLANAPGPVTQWRVRRNVVRANNKRACGGEGTPSGSGILMIGASRNKVTDNLVVRNRGPRPLGGGIVLVTAEPEGAGGQAIRPSNNRIRHNTALRNRRFDIFWDRTGVGNRFPDNRCRTSSPARICD